MTDRSAWAAGFFDGEGCVSIWRRNTGGKVYYSMKLDMYQVDKAPLDIFVLLFGGTVRPRPRPPSLNTNSRDGWVWSQSGHGAAETLKIMLPHMVCKRAQAEIAIEFQRLKGRTGPNPYADPTAHFEKEREQFEHVKRLKIVT
jgi:hypothetical protein